LGCGESSSGDGGDCRHPPPRGPLHAPRPAHHHDEVGDDDDDNGDHDDDDWAVVNHRVAMVVIVATPLPVVLSMLLVRPITMTRWGMRVMVMMRMMMMMMTDL
jgi:hypothetical protein